MREIATFGIHFVEASADTELDPLYLGPQYLDKWVEQVLDLQTRGSVRVANLYSGHGTYATLGLAHSDEDVRTRFLNSWLKPMVATANIIDAGLGFFCHAFPQSILADPSRFDEEFYALAGNLAKVAEYNMSKGGKRPVGVEQMYTPHQVPWTIDQSKKLLREIFAKAGAPFYITIDVGHQSGQHRFLRPSEEEFVAIVENVARTGQPPTRWIGPDSVVGKIAEAGTTNGTARRAIIDEVFRELERYPYLFANEQDSNPYNWLRDLSGWSPIIHLQQTDGTSSSHWPFDNESNRKGIIEGKKVLQAIRDHYDTAQTNNRLPDRVTEIYLTIEVFSGTAETPENIRKKVQDSVDYWRRFVPEDGKTVDKLLDRL